MQLPGEDIEPFDSSWHSELLRAGASLTAGLVGDRLDNRRAFGHDPAAVEARRRDLIPGGQL
nr:hypothetical protein [Bradyrhizobium sp. CCH5-F6]